MDETKIELPAWLPWATTACLAALVACLGELWIIEKTRSQMLKDETLLAGAALKTAQNQLEAERIVSRREIEGLRSGAEKDESAELLLPPGGDTTDTPLSGHPWGIAGRNARTGTAWLRIVGLPVLDAGRDYQFWTEAAGLGTPTSQVVQADPAGDGKSVTVSTAFPIPPGNRVLLISTVKGGARTLDEALAKGSIILASHPLSPKIYGR